MADDRAFFHALMRGLVQKHFPKQACAAQEIADFWAGSCSGDADLGGFSRKMNGERPWSLADALALMHITGSRRVPEAMLDRLKDHARPPEAPAFLAARAAKESGEAVAAAIEAGCADKIARECLEAEEAFRALRHRYAGTTD